MFDADEGPKEWELKEEEPPERLQKKWDRAETLEPRPVICPACKKETPEGNLTCIFCETILARKSCPLNCLFSWLKRLFGKK